VKHPLHVGQWALDELCKAGREEGLSQDGGRLEQ
jgi:hypothetical protein